MSVLNRRFSFWAGTGLTVILLVSVVLWADFRLLTLSLRDSERSVATDVIESDEPLYWVAPMDPNYRRDGPGKSPMGMDLIPVYRNTDSVAAGGVQIEVDTQHNLGIRLIEATHKRLIVERQVYGELTYAGDRRLHIHPRVDGWVETLSVGSVGDVVRKNQTLLTLYSPVLVNAQEELLLALEQNNAALINAAQARLKSLDISETALEKLDRQREISRTVSIYAPSDGVVTGLSIREGMFIRPNTEVMSIAPLDALWLLVDVPQGLNSIDLANASLVFSVEGIPQRKWHAEVDTVYPELHDTRRTRQLRAVIDNADGVLASGMYATVTIIEAPKPPVLSIPSESVIRVGTETRVVLQCDDNSFKSVDVVLGRDVGSDVEILSGLEHGD